jgi:hypothetical protein
VTTAHELLIHTLVADSAIRGCHLRGDDKAVMVFPLLFTGWLMTFEAINLLLGVHTEFVLVDHRELLVRMAFGTPARRTNQGGAGLVGNHARSIGVDQESRDEDRCSDQDSNENRSEGHDLLLMNRYSAVAD